MSKRALTRQEIRNQNAVLIPLGGLTLLSLMAIQGLVSAIITAIIALILAAAMVTLNKLFGDPMAVLRSDR